MIRAVFLASWLAVLAACGQKGPLRLPDSTPAGTPPPPPAPTSPLLPTAPAGPPSSP